MCVNSPESVVEVVDETTIDLSCANAAPLRPVVKAIVAAIRIRRLIMSLSR
jgi:hypothetical protein